MARSKAPRDVLFYQLAKYRREAQEGSFWAYCLFMDLPFFADRLFLKKVADAFQSVYDHFSRGESIRVAVSMPPRAGKSYITTLFATFMLGHYPMNSVMRNSVTNRLYRKFSYDARTIVKSTKFKAIFPKVELSEDIQSLEGWYIAGSKIPAYFGAGVGGTIIGFGANMLSITDDLFKGFQEAMSETVNESTWVWKEGEHDSRTERNCCEIDIGTRWSKDDVIGRKEENGSYDIIVRIPALDENDETFCEAVHSTEYYREKRNTIDRMIFDAEYQQEPIESSGLLFPHDELQYFKLSDIEDSTTIAKLGVCDTADTGTDFFSAPFANMLPDQKFYITDVMFTQDNVEVSGPLLAGKIIEHKPQKFLIESNNGGRIFAVGIKKDLLRKSSTQIETRFTMSNKVTRILMRSGFIKNNFVFRNDYAPGSDYEKFMLNLTSYVKTGVNKHDDAPDSLTILSEYIEYLNLITKHSGKKTISKSALGLR